MYRDVKKRIKKHTLARMKETWADALSLKFVLNLENLACENRQKRRYWLSKFTSLINSAINSSQSTQL